MQTLQSKRDKLPHPEQLSNIMAKNNVFNYIIKLDTSKNTVYSDLTGYTVGDGSITPELGITAEKPDIVIQDKSTNVYPSL